MQYFWFIFKSALEDFRRNKVRTLLTSLGILIGVGSVVLLMSFGLGLKAYIKGQFESLGTNLVIVTPGKLLQGGGFKGGSAPISTIKFDSRDVIKLKRLKNAKTVVPFFTKTVKTTFGQTNEYTDIYATTDEYFTMRSLNAEYGRLFDKEDTQKTNKIVVLGPKIAEKLFGQKESALLKNIKIEGQNYRVVGVLETKGGGGFGGPDFDSFIYMPYKAAYSFNPEKSFFAIYIQADSELGIPLLKEEISQSLLTRYHEDDFSVIEQTEILNAVSSIFSVLNIVLVAIAAISLVVGGIGIMNIMYVSVIERIREIGIRRAIGATSKDILFQFLIESVILSVMGGLLGLALSFGIVFLIHPFFPAYIDAQSVIIAIGVSSFIGITFGVFPAKKAADLSPIDAIRYE